MSAILLPACRKQYAPPLPEEGGKVRLSEVYKNGQLYRHYEYNDAGRLLRIIVAPGFSTEETAEFTYDNQGRISALLKNHPFSGIYLLSTLVYNSSGDLERQTEKVFRNGANQLLGEYQTNLSYAPVENIGKRITAITGLLPSGPVTGKEIYTIYSSRNYPKFMAASRACKRSTLAIPCFMFMTITGIMLSPVPIIGPRLIR